MSTTKVMSAADGTNIADVDEALAARPTVSLSARPRRKQGDSAWHQIGDGRDAGTLRDGRIELDGRGDGSLRRGGPGGGPGDGQRKTAVRLRVVDQAGPSGRSGEPGPRRRHDGRAGVASAPHPDKPPLPPTGAAAAVPQPGASPLVLAGTVADLDVARARSVGVAATRRRLETVREQLRSSAQAGLATAEYAIATIAAAGFAGLLIVILKSGAVKEMLTNIIHSALSVN